MAKFFLVLFSLLLSFSLGVFILDQVLPNSAQSPLADSSKSALDNDSSQDSSPAPIQIRKKNLDQFDIKQIYQTKLRPLVRKILSNEEVEVKTNNDLRTAESSNLESSADEEWFDDSEDAENLSQLKKDQTLAKMLTEDKKSEKASTKTSSNKSSAKPQSTPSPKPSVEVKASVPAKKAAQVTAKKEAPSSSEKKSSKAASTSIYSTPQGWCIQVAAFRSSSDAESVSADLEKDRYPNFIYQTDLNGNTWYRVNIGPFESPGAAATYKQSRNIGKKFKGAFVKKL